jgi:hypothetical protein
MANKIKKISLRIMTRKMTNTDVGRIVRLIVCILAFLAATFYLAHSCATLANNLPMLITPSVEVTIPWAVHMTASVLAMIVMTGVAVALLRPVWIGILTFAVGALLFPLVVGFGISTGISATVLFAVLLLNLLFVNGQMKNQIKFSSHPMGEKKLIIATLLTALICVSFGISYTRDSAKRNYVFPPEATTLFTQSMMKVAHSQIDPQKAPEAQKQVALKEAEAKFQKMISDAEAKVKPQQKYIPIGLGVFTFFILQMVLLLLAILSAPLIPLVFLFLKLTHFTHTETEQCKVGRLTLKTIDQ